MKPHRTDSISLFFGLAFLMIALGYLAKVYLRLDLPSIGWFIAGALIFLGVVGAITALVPSRRAAPVQQPQEQVSELDAEEPEREEEHTETERAR